MTREEFDKKMTAFDELSLVFHRFGETGVRIYFEFDDQKLVAETMYKVLCTIFEDMIADGKASIEIQRVTSWHTGSHTTREGQSINIRVTEFDTSDEKPPIAIMNDRPWLDV